MAATQPVSIAELIRWVKRELLTIDPEDSNPLFVVDEVTIEVNFVVDGKLRGGFNVLQIVEAGSEVSEQRVQKAVIKLSPLLSRDQLISEISTAHPKIIEYVKSSGVKAYLRGKAGQTDAPPR